MNRERSSSTKKTTFISISGFSKNVANLSFRANDSDISLRFGTQFLTTIIQKALNLWFGLSLGCDSYLLWLFIPKMYTIFCEKCLENFMKNSQIYHSPKQIGVK